MALGDAPQPASVLVFPFHRSDANTLTLLRVTNTATSMAGSTNVLFRYVNAIPNPANPLQPLSCNTIYRTEMLTPADTLVVATTCHNIGGDTQGYVVVSAQDPQGGAWSHNHLVGSTLVVDLAGGGAFALLPTPFQALGAPGSATDLDFNGRLDFNDLEYEALPDDLFGDSFLGPLDQRLVLFNLTGDRTALVTVQMLIWNDNEYPLSAQLNFRCWFQTPLNSVSTVFTESFLRTNTPQDPTEVDLNCDGQANIESGWLKIGGLTAVGIQTVVNPPMLGALVGGQRGLMSGQSLWGSIATSDGRF
jgi:hypothetical protein